MSAREISARSEGHLLWKIVDSIKGAEILRTLRDDGPKGVRQLQRSVGGSFTIIVKREKEFAEAGLIEIERNGNAKILRLTPRGERLINRIDRFFGG